jgi:hypothetical protein
MRKSRFVKAETVIVVEILGLLALALAPAMLRASIRHRADRVAADVEVVCAAAEKERLESGWWPADEPAGHVPGALVAGLPRTVSFSRGDVTLDWDHWKLSEGTGRRARTGEMAAIGVTARDPHLLDRVVERLGARRRHFTLGDRVTFVLADSTAEPGIDFGRRR